jgi:hypothetical protein
MKLILDSNLSAPAHIREVEPRSEKDDTLFAELADVLKKHNALDRIGVSLLHRHFDIKPGEVLLETTDIPSRVQTIRPVPHDEMTTDPYIETSWRLGDGWIAMGCKCVKMGDDHQHLSRGATPQNDPL